LVSSFASIFVSVSRAASADIDYPSRVAHNAGITDRNRRVRDEKRAYGICEPPARRKSMIAVASMAFGMPDRSLSRLPIASMSRKYG